MNKGDKIIWDSHFGYEIGYYVGKSKNQYHRHEVDLITGMVNGIVSHPLSEIKPYTPELVQELTDKYGYEKAFSDIF